QAQGNHQGGAADLRYPQDSQRRWIPRGLNRWARQALTHERRKRPGSRRLPMKFAAILKSLLLVTAVSLLAACGGGYSGGDSAFQPATVQITATPTATSVQACQSNEIAVKVTHANVTNVAGGTLGNSTSTSATNGVLE